MLDPKVTIAFEGPFFTKDPTQTIRGNIRAMLEALAEQGQQDVQDHSPVLTGAFKAGVVGRVASMSGKRWQLHAVVSQQHIYPWGARRSATVRSGRKIVANSEHAQYRGGKLERRYGMFRRTASRIRSMKALISADLSKGLE